MKTKIEARTKDVPYVDANALVYALLFNDDRTKALQTVFANGGTVSALTIDELIWVARRQKYARVHQLVYDLLSHPTLEFVEARPTTQLYATELMMEHNLKPRDALHLAIMEEEGTDIIISYDTDFDRVPGITRIAP